MRTGSSILIAVIACAVACNSQPPGQPSPRGNANLNDNVDQNSNSAIERFSLVASTVGGGSVEPSAGTYRSGEEVTLTAEPDSGWSFERWEGDVEGDEPVITVSVVADTSVTAYFVKLPTPPDPPQNENENQNDNAGDDPPGGDFASAMAVVLDANDRATILESLARSSDVHVYDLGPLELGDGFSAICRAGIGSGLDPMMALFDENGFRAFWNDDRDLDGGDFDSAVSGLIRHDSEHYYLAVTSTDFAETSGSYSLLIEIDRGAGVPAISGHTIVIDFNAAQNVTIAGTAFGSHAAFDAANLHVSLAGQTEVLKAAIAAHVETDFAAYDMTVLTSDDPLPAGQFTRVFIGGIDDELFGIADSLDFYNERRDDDVIVFALGFGGLSSNLDTLGQAIANVVSHEVGHSLGLMHTLDGAELMDNSPSDLPLLSDQAFGTAGVFDFPIGLQNAPLLLSETLGPVAKRAQDGPGLRCGTCGAAANSIYRFNSP